MMPAIYGNSYQIVQGPGFVAIRYEMIHETRVIPLDGRPHVDQDIRLYMGDPRGHWEGNTLVVETTNFNGRMSADIVGYGSPDRGASAQLRIVERFTPVQPDHRRVVGHARRSAHVDPTVDVCDEPDEGRHATGVRVRVSRGELRAEQHPQCRAS